MLIQDISLYVTLYDAFGNEKRIDINTHAKLMTETASEEFVKSTEIKKNGKKIKVILFIFIF